MPRQKGYRNNGRYQKNRPDNSTDTTSPIDVKVYPAKKTDSKYKPSEPAMITRLASKSEAEISGGDYCIFHVDSLTNLINMSIKAHLQHFPLCPANFRMVKHEQRIISTTWYMVCETCHFSGPCQKMYQEMSSSKSKRGRKFSTLNLALGSALVSSSIHARQFSEIFMTLGVDPGSERGLQKCINRASDIIKNEAEQNMLQERAELSEAQEVHISVDSMYNNRITSDGTTPFQPGTQRISSVAECNSPQKKIIHVDITNKICKEGSISLIGGKPIQCPNHEGCTADVPLDSAIGDESQSLKRASQVLKKENVNVSTVTTDGDSSMRKTISACFGESVSHKIDPRHFSRSFKSAIQKQTFSSQAFKGTKDAKQKTQNKLATDLQYRVDSELSAAYASLRTAKTQTYVDESAKVDQLYYLLQNTHHAIIKCVTGKCGELCSQFSYVCDGSRDKSWSKVKGKLLDSEVLLSADDEEKLEKIIISKRLGKDALKKVSLDGSTQKNESFNRSVIKTVPKSTTFTRTLKGRALRPVLTLNLGLVNTIHRILGQVGHIVSPKIIKKWVQLESHRQYLKSYRASPLNKRKRRLRSLALYRLHAQKKKRKAGYSHAIEIDV